MAALWPANDPAIVYINHGRYVADCPAGCNNAMVIDSGQTAFLCGVWHKGELKGGCFATATLQWPSDPVGLMVALSGREVQHRNWAPAGHRQNTVSYTRDGRLVAEAYPDGQTVTDLLTEGTG